MVKEDVFKSIENNTFLDNDFKDNLKELVTIFNTFFPTVDLSNLNERVKTLKITKVSKYASKDIIDYLPLQNELSFNLEEVMKNYDIKHILMHGLLRIITAHDNTFGFDCDEKFLALNVGYTEILTNFIVGNSSELTIFDDEVIAADLIGEIVGNDILLQSYFTNNSNLLASQLVSKGVK